MARGALADPAAKGPIGMDRCNENARLKIGAETELRSEASCAGQNGCNKPSVQYYEPWYGSAEV